MAMLAFSTAMNVEWAPCGSLTALETHLFTGAHLPGSFCTLEHRPRAKNCGRKQPKGDKVLSKSPQS